MNKALADAKGAEALFLALPPSHRLLLRRAAREPGSRLKIGDFGRSYMTMRIAAMELRAKGVLFGSKPACVLLRPGWARDKARLEQLQADRVAWLICRLHGQPQPNVTAAISTALDIAESTVERRLADLRRDGTLHPWDGLVLTPYGEQVAQAFGPEVPRVAKQTGDAP